MVDYITTFYPAASGRDIKNIMKIIVDGVQKVKKINYTWDLIARYDPETKIHSMDRTTSYTATVVLRMMKQRLFDQKGIIPPELIGKKPEYVKYVFDRLKDRGIICKETISEKQILINFAPISGTQGALGDDRNVHPIDLSAWS